MSYAVVTDMQARFPNRDLVQLSNEDPTVTIVNAAFIQTALSDSSAEIDTYLEARFALPLTDPPATLVRLCCDVAMYRMQALRPLHDVAEARKRYDDVIATLQRVAAGELTLGLAADGLEPPDPANPAIVVVQAGGDPGGTIPPRLFSRGQLKGF
jgi:phage gp36-like protein